MKIFSFSISALALAFGTQPLSAQSMTTQIVVSGLSSPLDLESPPGDSRLFIAEQTGRIRIVNGTTISPTPFFDASSLVASGSFTGLRGLCFHPNYSSNGFVYIAYDTVSSGAGDVVFDRLTVSSTDPNALDPASRVEILRVAQTQAWHGGGDMAFGPDGYFYTAIGDGHGFGGDPFCNAQNGTVLLGKMLRLDVDGGFPYAIPADNPFVGDPTVRDEIWHLGFRHPWRWSFDSATDDLYIADVGQSGQEEIDFVAAGTSGLNFGWKVKEGTACNSTSACASVAPCSDPGYTDPILTQPTSLNCSITGGFVYRGNALPQEYGKYFFAAYCSGDIWTLDYDGTTVTNFAQRNGELGGALGNLVSFGQDAFGELYILRQNGTVLKIVPDCGFAGLCATSFCFGNGGVSAGCTSCPCNNDATPPVAGGCSNSVGMSAALVALGSSSAAVSNLRFEVFGANPQTFGILQSADNRLPQMGPCPPGSGITSPVLDGLRCVGGAALRHGTRATDTTGDIGVTTNGWGPPNGPPGGLPASAGFIAGQTRHFQCFYREDVALGCMTGQNTTNAVTVTFQ